VPEKLKRVPSNLAVVLVSPRNPLNIGAAARAMSNFGCFDLRLVNPYDVAFREAKSAVKAGYILERARVFDQLPEAIADCELVVGTTSLDARAAEHPVRRLEYGGKLLRRHMSGSARAALLFGSEKFGLGNDDLSHCQWLMRIPTRQEHGSMNLGQSVAVCLYELIRSTAAARTIPEPKQPAKAEDLERITALLMDVLGQSGYVHARVAGSTELKTRRLVRRMDLTAHDAEIWLGMLRQIGWKLSQCYPESE
jgi:tRNA/rRNA methyltransferase